MTSHSAILGKGAAIASILATLYFLAAAVASQALLTRYDVFKDYISDYAIGPLGWIYGSAFWASCIGCFALVIALSILVPSNASSKMGLGLLVVVGVTYAIDFFYPTDILPPGAPPTTANGTIHLVAALVGWLLFTVSAFLLTSRLERDAYWKPWYAILIGLTWLSALLLVGLVAVVVSKVPFGGLAEKGFILDRNIWALIVGVLVYRSLQTSAILAKR